jgi:DnaJ-class molecular chaperone
MDYYQTLGVGKSASEADIRKAYKKLAREYHPDRKPDDKAAEQKFKEIQSAYEVLGDPKKRQQYDQLGPAYEQYRQAGGSNANPFGGGFNPQGNQQPFGEGGIDLGDLFSGIFGAGQPGGKTGQRGSRANQSRQRKPAEDEKVEITIPFNLAATGGQYSLDRSTQGQREVLEIKIPQGIHEGATIRLAGQGSLDPYTGSPGDLLIKVKIAPHPWFKRDGQDLYIDVPLTITEASLGTKVEVPTLSDGMVWVTIPPGTSSSAKLRLREKGIFNPKLQAKGDQYVVIKIVSPKHLDEQARALLENLQQLLTEKPRQQLWQL